ncbi:MAG: transglycosylase domain-containing protein [Desulfopila sp.]|jgi:membrane peptidoglycan carboxypeptidase|nr:transglycosylase domain-containing protein [Desulfopila sp.]
MIKKIVLFLVFSAVMAALAGGAALYWLIVLHPGDEIRVENISNILGKESPVFYSDGTTRLGVFFDEAHRQYVSYEEIPVHFINALVASEDNRFFSHFGFDLLGILRAAVKNIESRRIVQGGSTLTQQTAKNLFKRQNRSIEEKLKELLFALRLEYHYPKEKIFEFYANQFYVSGNGHGLGVAARYYFDKKPEELSLLQCAYIAGSVKRPNAYNPFIKGNEENTKQALKRGRARVNYVLDRMFELGMISDYQYGHAKVGDLEFKNGRVGFPLDYVMDMVKDAVGTTEISEALEKHDISNIATSGVRIVTTVDEKLQEQALYSLRHDLSRLDVRLRGYEREEVQKELEELNYRGDTTLKSHAFFFGVIESVSGEGSSAEILVDLEHRSGSGIIDKNGFARLVEARLQWQKNPWSVVAEKDHIDFVKQLQPGDTVWVSVRQKDEKGRILLDLEKFPKVNGGVLVIKDGLIKAVTGGVENRFYNRAIYARRTMGSSFKPFVFAAALQLGWNAADNLQNSRDVFIYHNQPYFPRPDHDSPFDEVSMSWAATKSENLASVWLVSHLCDKLTDEQFLEVAQNVGLAPKVLDGEEEPYSSFRIRIRDRQGIVITRETLQQAAYSLAVNNVETDFIFAGRDLEYSLLKKMHYGQNFAALRESITQQLNEASLKLSNAERNELLLRRKLLSGSYLEYAALRDQFDAYAQSFADHMALSSFAFSESSTEVGSAEDKGGMLYYDGFAKQYVFLRDRSASGGMTPLNAVNVRNILRDLEGDGRLAFWNNVYLNGKISVEGFDLLAKQIKREVDFLQNMLPYSMDVLKHVEDYRILVGLRYLISLAREMGIKSDLEPVLSFPLGSNAVTLLETLRVYEALATGKVIDAGRSDVQSSDLLSIIARIESSEGEVLYSPKLRSKELLAPETYLATGHMLENVVKYGTGRYADENIKLTENESSANEEMLNDLALSIPVLGKTGTANRYTNASFFGFLPGPAATKDSLILDGGYAVGVYVGFDDNEEMRKGATRISGSAGALPVWSEVVNSIVRYERFSEKLDTVDLSFYGLSIGREDVGQKNIAVAANQGGIVPKAVQRVEQTDRYTPSILTFGKIENDGSFSPERRFAPYWRVSPLETMMLSQ